MASAASRNFVVRAVEARRAGKKRREKEWRCSRAKVSRRLPPELVNNILARLPPRYFCRSAVVCKEWHPEVTSRYAMAEYSRRWSGGLMDAPTLALVSAERVQPAVAFNTELKKWVRVPTLFHGDECHDTHLVAEARGLYVHNIIVARTRMSDGAGPEDGSEDDPDYPTQLVVSNPWTGATKWLPPMLQHDNYFFGRGTSTFHLEVDHDGEAYTVMCINTQGGQVLELYHSREGYWRAVHVPAIITTPSGDVQYDSSALYGPGVVLGRHVYFVAYDSGWIIVSFNIDDWRWRWVCPIGKPTWPEQPGSINAEPNCDGEPYRASCDNRLVVVSLKRRKKGGGSVLVLDMERNLLVHETSVPRKLASRLVLSVQERIGAIPLEGRKDRYIVRRRVTYESAPMLG